MNLFQNHSTMGAMKRTRNTINVSLKLFSFIIFAFLITSCASTTSNQANYTQAKTDFQEQNYYNAFQAFLVPAEKGNSDAEYALGYMYYYGKGTPVNQTLGKQWILKSVLSGNLQAKQAYQMILSHEQSIYYTPPKKAITPHTVQLPKFKHTKKPAHHSNAVKKTALSTMNSQHFALQLFDATSAKHAETFIHKYQLSKHAKYFHKIVKKKSLYVVIYGNYTTRAHAKQAIKKLPSNIQKLKPWIRSVASLKKELHSS
jgi:septal ring-binding cell division protein DamX